MSAKKRIAIDVDDVIISFTEAAIAYVTKYSGKPVYAHELYTSTPNGFSESGLSEAEFIRHVTEFQESDEMLLAQPMVGVIHAIEKLSAMYDIHFVTSRNPKHEEHTRRWFERHLTEILPVHDITFIGNHYTNSEIGTKAEICKRLSAVWLIDDQPKYADQLKGHDTKVVLFGEYHWNRDHAGSHFVRAKDWNEVLKHVL